MSQRHRVHSQRELHAHEVTGIVGSTGIRQSAPLLTHPFDL